VGKVKGNQGLGKEGCPKEEEVMPFMTIARVEEIEDGQALVVQLGTEEIAVFNIGGVIHAVENCCPHMGGPLAEGIVQGHSVICPWHAWSFDLKDGACETVPGADIRRYEVRVLNGEIQLNTDLTQ
jgi:nitrite reductase (NADH) small subunit